MPPTFINWLMNLRKLGQISSPFCICTSVRRCDKEASNVNGINKHIWLLRSGEGEVASEKMTSFRTSLQTEICNFAD